MDEEEEAPVDALEANEEPEDEEGLGDAASGRGCFGGGDLAE